MENSKKIKSIIRSEINIEKYPIFSTSTNKSKSREIVREYKLPDGNVDTRKVTIGKINDVEVGIFRVFDFKGFCALVKIWEEQGRPTKGNIFFSLHQIAQVLELSWGGKSYKEIKAMLMRLRKIPIDWVNSFYNKENDEIESLVESFNILSDLKIFEKGKKNKQIALALSSFAFDKRLVNNLIRNYSKPLILDNILKFKKEVSILLYRYVDLMLSNKNRFECTTSKLINDLDLSQDGYPYPAQRKKLFAPVIKELQGVEISTGFIKRAELVRTKNEKDWKVVFEKEKKAEVDKDIEIQAPVTQTKQDVDLAQKLISRGITDQVARALINNFPESLVDEKISIFDLLMKGKSNLISKNPAGWLRRSIENDYISPIDLDQNERDIEAEEKKRNCKKCKGTGFILKGSEAIPCNHE